MPIILFVLAFMIYRHPKIAFTIFMIGVIASVADSNSNEESTKNAVALTQGMSFSILPDLNSSETPTPVKITFTNTTDKYFSKVIIRCVDDKQTVSFDTWDIPAHSTTDHDSSMLYVSEEDWATLRCQYFDAVVSTASDSKSVPMNIKTYWHNKS